MSISHPPFDRSLDRASPDAWSLAWRIIKGAVVFVIVAFHLIVLLIRNPLDLWDKEIREWLRNKPDWGGALAATVDADLAPPEKSLWDHHEKRYKKANRFTYVFTNTVGIEQNWVMFSPPVAKKVYFLGLRVYFTDGTNELIKSENEPDDPTSFFRLGNWQLRKLESYLGRANFDTFTESGPEKRLWEAYIRYQISKWKERNPGDPRTISTVRFVSRRLDFPKPGETLNADAIEYPLICDANNDPVDFDVNGRMIR